MAYKLITAPLAFATSVSQVVAQECAQNLLTTHAGVQFYLYDDSLFFQITTNLFNFDLARMASLDISLKTTALQFLRPTSTMVS